MAVLRLDELAGTMEGRIVQGDSSLEFRNFNIDSRLCKSGDLFFAIVDRRNGHDYVADAALRGAAGAVISEDIIPPHKKFALIRVKDTQDALQTLARRVLSQQRTKVVGITGSIGKTTTKEFTAALLSSKYNVLSSEGNFNNQLGLALSLLKLDSRHEVAVLEMAMSGRGEILRLTKVAPPDVAVITNINPVHLQFLGSLEEVAQAKREILEGTKKGGAAVLNGDDSRVREIGRSWPGRKIYFGFSAGCDVRAQNIKRIGYEGMSFELDVLGKTAGFHFPFLYESFLSDLLAAAGVALAFSLSIEDISAPIESLRPFPKRGVLVQLGREIRLVDDTYNSNPRALESALGSLVSLPAQRRVAVLGDMLELGQEEQDFHEKAGRQVAALGWDVLVTVGPLSRKMAEGARQAGMKEVNIHSFDTSEEAAARIWPLLKNGDLVLVKGSRGMRTERVVEEMKKRAQEKES